MNGRRKTSCDMTLISSASGNLWFGGLYGLIKQSPPHIYPLSPGCGFPTSEPSLVQGPKVPGGQG